MLKKITDIALETTSNYREKSKLNVRLWNQDKGVSVLKFLVTRDNFPLSLSSENVKMIIVIENGENFISSDDFEISSEVDGVASFQIPDDFMAAATGECVAQVYVGTLDNDEVVVYRQITFEISQDLLSSIPSELKLQYIKTFSDLADSISTRLLQVEEDMATMEDYVVAVNQATTDGLNALNNLVNAKTVEYNDNHANKLALINNTVDGYVQDFLDQRSYIDTKYAEFQTAVGGSGLVTVGDAESWQKYKLTNDDGTYKLTNLNNDPSALQALAPGYYYTTNTPGIVATSTAGYTHVEQRDSLVKRITFRPYNSNQEFIMRYYNEWTSWENKFDGLEKSIDAQSKANTAENNAKVYVDSKVDEQHNILFSGSVNGVGQTVNLTGNMNDYEYIIISGDCSGNDFSQIMVPSIIGTIFNMQNLNLRDSDGLLLGVYECRLETTSTTIKITNDVAYDHPSDTGSGPNRNAYTITRVEGVHRK